MNVYKCLIYLSLFLSCSINSGFSQSISGTIKTSDGLPAVYVDIKNASDKSHTHSDESRYFTLTNVALSDTIKVLFLGYETQNLIISDLSSSIEIILKEKSISLDEIIIAPQLDALNIISKIDINTAPVNSAQELLTRVPGLFIG